MFTDIWTAHLQTEEEKQRFLSQLESAKPILERLNNMLAEKKDAIDTSFLSLAQYQNVNWQLTAAHKYGMASAYDAVQKLVTIQDDNDSIRRR